MSAVPALVHQYWTFRHELTFHERLLFKQDNTVLSSLFLFVRRYSTGFMLATTVSGCFWIQRHGIKFNSYWGSLQWLLWAWSASKLPVLGGHSSTWAAFWPHWNAPHSYNWQWTPIYVWIIQGFCQKVWVLSHCIQTWPKFTNKYFLVSSFSIENSGTRWAQGAQNVAAKSVIKMAGRFPPPG